MPQYDVTAIGVAFVDVVANVTVDFLEKYDLSKGQGNVLPVATLRDIRRELMDSRVIPGGTAANSMANLASLGGKAAFIGKACKDTMGESFQDAFEKLGVKNCVPLVEFDRDVDKATARCLVLVTPDHDRTFVFNMGVCEELDEADIDVETIKNSKVLFVEGQMLVSRRAREAVRYAISVAKKHCVKVAFNMHDLNYRAVAVQEVVDIIRTQSDILIGNKREISGAFELDQDTVLEDFVQVLNSKHQVLAVTRGSKGACIFHDGGIATIPSENKLSIVDSTGAGDAFAAGFLFGLTHDFSIEAAGKMAALTAAEIIQIWGGRPEKKLSEVFKDYISEATP
ncbi:MAG: adenosine kinase [Alphaproteobacteria bacterium]|nr:adenosine kinase [Alphaproteobacteria bacterium]